MLKYFSNAARMVPLFNNKKRRWKTELYIFTGVPGAGKSYGARAHAREFLAELGLDEEPYHFMVPASKTDKVWFQNYNGESVVIIDEFYGQIGINVFKNLIDE